MDIKVKRFDELTIDELYDILQIRAAVFVVEQECAYQDVDGKDRNAYHVWVEEDGEIKAYLRVLGKGVAFEDLVGIGRVQTMERGKGYGDIILDAGIDVVKNRLHEDKVKIEAQVYATGFYKKHGFKIISEEFLEDGIPHVEMLLEM